MCVCWLSVLRIFLVLVVLLDANPGISGTTPRFLRQPFKMSKKKINPSQKHKHKKLGNLSQSPFGSVHFVIKPKKQKTTQNLPSSSKIQGNLLCNIGIIELVSNDLPKNV